MDKILLAKVIVKGNIYPITNPYCLFGSADGCDVKIKGTAPTHFQIEFNSEKEAFLRCFKPVTLDGHSVCGVSLLPNVALISVQGKKFTFLKQVQRMQKRIKPEEEARQFILGQNDPDDLCEKYINDFIGRGVFATKVIRNGKFIAEYHGVLLKADEVKDKDTNYTYFFGFNGVKYCIDATEEPELYQPSLGRLVNHADTKQERNSRMTIIDVEGVPHLALFATRDIQAEEEIRYDYGVRDLPWATKGNTAKEMEKGKNKNIDKKVTIRKANESKQQEQESLDRVQVMMQTTNTYEDQFTETEKNKNDGKQLTQKITERDSDTKWKEKLERQSTEESTEHDGNKKTKKQDRKQSRQEIPDIVREKKMVELRKEKNRKRKT